MRDASYGTETRPDTRRALSQKAAIRRNLVAIFASVFVLGAVIYAGLATQVSSMVILIAFVLLTGICVGLLGNIFYIVVFDQSTGGQISKETDDLLMYSKVDRVMLSVWFPFLCLGIALISFIPMLGIVKLLNRMFG